MTYPAALRLAVLLCLGACGFSAQATQIVIANQDGAGEGFNDATPVAPVGGNPGMTLGEQRLIVFRHAAKVWQSVIASNVTITVAAQFDPLTCTASQAVLGSAGTTSIHRNFPGAPLTNTWYPQALANSLANSDLGASADISATFNADIDNNNNCLNNTNWYYGLDGNKPAGTIELFSVVLHEIGHGLGFQTFVDLNTGARFNNINDTYMLKLEDHSLSPAKTWDQLSNNGRLASATKTSYLHWVGQKVTDLVANYSGGINQGHVRMYAPATLSAGSSVSHFSNSVSPNELMEPFDTGPKTGPGLALPLLEDIGWQVPPSAAPVLAVLGDQAARDGETIGIPVLVLDNDTPLASLTLSAQSANSAIVEPGGLSFSGSGRRRTLWLAPKTGSSGDAGISVTVSDGGNSASESFTVHVTLNNPPQVSLSRPADNEGFLDSDFVALEASASDVEDGDLSALIGWSSNLDGFLGSGAALSVQLSEGTHILTATASDSGGKSSAASVTVHSYGSGDSDADGMPDNWEFTHFGSLAQTASGDVDGDGLDNLGEYNAGADPNNPDSDADGLSDGDEVNLYGLDPTRSDKGDVGPRGAPDGLLNAGDLVVMSRLVAGVIAPSSLETALADVNGDGVLNAADLLLLQQAILNATPL